MSFSSGSLKKYTKSMYTNTAARKVYATMISIMDKGRANDVVFDKVQVCQIICHENSGSTRKCREVYAQQLRNLLTLFNKALAVCMQR